MGKSRRLFDVAIADFKFVVARSSDGWVLPVPEKNGHITILCENGRLTGHFTNHLTGQRVQLASIDLLRAAQKFEDEDLQREVLASFLRALKPMAAPRNLVRRGVRGLSLPPQDGTFQPPVRTPHIMEWMEKAGRQPVVVAWEAPIGAGFFALDAWNHIVGQVLVIQTTGGRSVCYLSKASLIRWLRNFLSVLLDPEDLLESAYLMNRVN